VSDAPAKRGASRGAGLALRWLAFAVVLAVLVQTLAKADLPRASALIASAGPGIALLLVPFAVALLLDSVAFRRIFAILGHRVPFLRLLPIRITAEAVTLSLPGGVVFAETLSPMLLERRCGVPFSESVVAGTAKRWLLMRAQAGYIALAAILGFDTLSRASVPLLGMHGLPYIVLASSLGPLLISPVVASTLVGGTWVERIRVALHAIPIRPLRLWLHDKRAGFAATDAGFGRLGSEEASRALVIHTLLIFCAWLLESLETFLILRLLMPRAPLSYSDVIGFEAGLALVRHMAFFAPAGLGVQDLGYFAVFEALGLPNASALGAAFVVLKRAKEILWILTGYLLLLVARRSPPLPAAPPLPLEAHS